MPRIEFVVSCSTASLDCALYHNRVDCDNVVVSVGKELRKERVDTPAFSCWPLGTPAPLSFVSQQGWFALD